MWFYGLLMREYEACAALRTHFKGSHTIYWRHVALPLSHYEQTGFQLTHKLILKQLSLAVRLFAVSHSRLHPHLKNTYKNNSKMILYCQRSFLKTRLIWHKPTRWLLHVTKCKYKPDKTTEKRCRRKSTGSSDRRKAAGKEWNNEQQILNSMNSMSCVLDSH